MKAMPDHLRTLLQDIDSLLLSLEDTAKGEQGDAITAMRGRIADLLNQEAQCNHPQQLWNPIERYWKCLKCGRERKLEKE
jgi:hypothetical protein